MPQQTHARAVWLLLKLQKYLWSNLKMKAKIVLLKFVIHSSVVNLLILYTFYTVDVQ